MSSSTKTIKPVEQVVTPPPFAKIGVVGVGLIGGSFALAVRQAWPQVEVVGLARDSAKLAPAQAAGIVQAVRAIRPESVADLDAVLLATPVSATQQVLATVLPGLRPNVVLFDAGSTKQDVAAAAQAALGPMFARFVPAHPIAGSEQSGWQAAQANLYVGRRVILTPLPETAADAVAHVRAVWQACGANVSELGLAEHDAVFAQVSHFPHLLAFAYMQQVLRAENAVTLLNEAGTGFRDFTRIAGSDPKMWTDICQANQANLKDCVAAFQRSLSELMQQLETDPAVFEQRLAEISAGRRAWPTKG